MRCPKCDEELAPFEFEEPLAVTIDVCPSCRGAWFDPGELDALDDSAMTNAEELEFEPAEVSEARYHCPRCGAENLEPVSPVEDTHLVVDRCPSCEGFWLDPGELAALRRIALERDDARLAHVVPITKPRDWSWLRWAAYCIRKAYGA